jgi:hypothetical protein
MADKAKLLEENYLLRKEVERLRQTIDLLGNSSKTERHRSKDSRPLNTGKLLRLKKPTVKRMRDFKENSSRPLSKRRLRSKGDTQAKNKGDHGVSRRLQELYEAKALQISNFQETCTPQSLKGLAWTVDDNSDLSSTRTLKEPLSSRVGTPQYTSRTSPTRSPPSPLYSASKHPTADSSRVLPKSFNKLPLRQPCNECWELLCSGRSIAGCTQH